jgi:hypothetical protein
MITEPVPVPSQDTPRPRRSDQSARALRRIFRLSCIRGQYIARVARPRLTAGTPPEVPGIRGRAGPASSGQQGAASPVGRAGKERLSSRAVRLRIRPAVRAREWAAASGRRAGGRERLAGAGVGPLG